MRKLIKISTHMFDLTIHWNSAIMGLQLAILLGVVFLKVFSCKPNVDVMCTAILICNLIVILFSLFSGLHFSVEDLSGNNKAKSEPVSPVNRQPVQGKPVSKNKAKTNSQITNKVAVPNPPISPTTKVSTPAEGQRMGDMESVNIAIPNAPADLSSKTVEEMTEADWEKLFNMDGE